jgi:hypothetical protein
MIRTKFFRTIHHSNHKQARVSRKHHKETLTHSHACANNIPFYNMDPSNMTASPIMAARMMDKSVVVV